MLNVIRSQIYIIKRDRYMYYSMLFLLFYMLIGCVDGIENLITMKEFSGGMALAQLGEVLGVFLPLIPVLLSGRICGWDFNDKTLNYEVLYGHPRRDSYWARVIVSTVITLVIGYVLLMAPVAVGCIAGGWGKELPAGEAALRFTLCSILIIRMNAFMAMCTFMTRNCWSGIGLGLLGLLFPAMGAGIGEIFREGIMEKLSVFFTALASSELLSLEDYTMGFADDKDIVLITDRLDPDFAVPMVIVSVVLTMIYLIIGYSVFRRSDIH